MDGRLSSLDATGLSQGSRFPVVANNSVGLLESLLSSNIWPASSVRCVEDPAGADMLVVIRKLEFTGNISLEAVVF